MGSFRDGWYYVQDPTRCSPFNSSLRNPEKRFSITALLQAAKPPSSPNCSTTKAALSPAMFLRHVLGLSKITVGGSA